MEELLKRLKEAEDTFNYENVFEEFVDKYVSDMHNVPIKCKYCKEAIVSDDYIILNSGSIVGKIFHDKECLRQYLIDNNYEM